MVDLLLGGGLREGQLTEMAGPSSSCKTQVCLCVSAHVVDRSYGAVIFFDSCNSFSASRLACILHQLPRSFVKEPVDVRLKRIMSRIVCKSVFDIFQLNDMILELESSLKNKVNIRGSKICLLVIDSMSSLIAPVIGLKSGEGRMLMVSIGIALKRLAHEHNIAVLVTNHMVAGEQGSLKPALGESWKSLPHVRVLVSRDHGSCDCMMTILKHTLVASGRRVKFVIPS